ncbi:amidase, partial [Streptomyces sp. SID6013]|nr:amidase [Streptomyces sp. SID6013]
ELEAGGVEVWPMIAEMAERGRKVTGRQVYAAFTSGKTEIYNAFAGALTGADVLVTPTTPVPAFPHAGDYGPRVLVDGQETAPLALLIHSMTEPPAHAGLPALSVPGGFTSGGLPVGLQFIGPLWADADVVSVAARYQRATDWHTRYPEI